MYLEYKIQDSVIFQHNLRVNFITVWKPIINNDDFYQTKFIIEIENVQISKLFILFLLNFILMFFKYRFIWNYIIIILTFINVSIIQKVV